MRQRATTQGSPRWLPIAVAPRDAHAQNALGVEQHPYSARPIPTVPQCGSAMWWHQAARHPPLDEQRYGGTR